MVQIGQVILYIIPVFSVVNGFIKIALKMLQWYAFNELSTTKPPKVLDMDSIKPFDWYVSRYNLVVLCMSFVLYWLLLLLIESRVLSCLCRKAMVQLQ